MTQPNAALAAGWPTPEVWARVARPEEVPVRARRFAQTAVAHGWSALTRYARGTAPKSRDDWTPGAVVDSVLVQAYRSGVLISAIWEDGRATSAWITINQIPHRVSVTQARAVLEA